MDQAPILSVLCVDDNPSIAAALRVKLARAKGFEWKGALTRADDLVDVCRRDCPGVVLLDIDMPGKDPFVALRELVEQCPQTLVIIFSGHVRRDLIERALDAGAWGYASKNDGEDELLSLLRRVVAGELGLSPEAKRLYDS